MKKRDLPGAIRILCVISLLGVWGGNSGFATEQNNSSTARGTGPTGASSGTPACETTQSDSLGPFYKPGAPVRSRVGEGYTLSGVVKSSGDCAPVANARIELWLAGPDGRYDDAYRATVISDQSGAYNLESHFPPPYAGRPSHVHIRVTADGYRTLVTQHYPRQGESRATFDLVLVPESS